MVKINKINYEFIWDKCWDEAVDEIGEFEDEEDEDNFLANEEEIFIYARELFKMKTGKDWDDVNYIKY